MRVQTRTSLPLLTAAEAAERLQVSRRTLRRFVERGPLPAIQLTDGGPYRFDPTDVEALVERSRRPST
jgi:excisionase family DNA binding protein